jgi:transcriptional regulator with XRE-family HTH domain
MTDFQQIIEEQLANPAVAREYYRIMPYYHLADQILLLRKQRGMTQQELAEKAGTTQAVVSRIESTSVRPSLETAIRLAEALGAVVDLHLTVLEDKPGEEPAFEQAGRALAPVQQLRQRKR